ncbi:hypothetical protein ACQEU6_33585 [Spirillospora sp. CA-108201]
MDRSFWRSFSEDRRWSAPIGNAPPERLAGQAGIAASGYMSTPVQLIDLIIIGDMR